MGRRVRQNAETGLQAAAVRALASAPAGGGWAVLSSREKDFGRPARRVCARRRPQAEAWTAISMQITSKKHSKHTKHMNQELSWDDPSYFYDSGLFWDESAPTPPPTTSNPMNTYKVVVSYTNRPNAQLAVLAQSAHDSVSANAVTFPNPPITMANFQIQITDFNAKLVARENRSIQDVAALRLARAAMIPADARHLPSRHLPSGAPASAERAGNPTTGLFNNR